MVIFTAVSDASVTNGLVNSILEDGYSIDMIDYSRPQTLMLSVGGNMIDVLVSSSNVTIQGSLESVGIVNYAIQFNGSSYVVVDDSQTTILDDTDNIISLGSN